MEKELIQLIISRGNKAQSKKIAIKGHTVVPSNYNFPTSEMQNTHTKQPAGLQKKKSNSQALFPYVPSNPYKSGFLIFNQTQIAINS